jgi:ribose transport system permease protein
MAMMEYGRIPLPRREAEPQAARHAEDRHGAARLADPLFRAGALIALLLLGASLALASPHFLNAGNLANVLRQSAVTAILAVGQTMVILTAGIDLSIAAIAAVSASSAAVLMMEGAAGIGVGAQPAPLAVAVGLALATLCGVLNGLIITKGRIPDFIATLGMLGVFRGVALLVTGGLPVPSHRAVLTFGAGLPESVLWLGNGTILGVPSSALIALAVALGGGWLLRYSALGRSLYAVGGNREAARVCGINVDRAKIAAYALAGLCAGVAGLVLTGRINSANALMADGEELRSIAAVVIGGTSLFGGQGGVSGSVLGALIIGVLGNGMNLLDVSPFWQRIIQGLVIILVVIVAEWRRRQTLLR